MGTAPVRARSSNTGCSSRQDTHHDAHTLSNHTLPSMSFCVNGCCGFASCASWKAGAGLPTSGDGTSRGFRRRPMPRNAMSTANAARIIKCRFISGYRFATGKDLVSATLGYPAVTPVRQGNKAAERHDEASAPYPYHEWLVIDAHAPRAIGNRLAERNVKIAEQAG